MKGAPGLYLICANDRLETAFFCGTAEECRQVLGIRNINTFYSMISKHVHFLRGFVTVEKVTLPEEEK